MAEKLSYRSGESLVVGPQRYRPSISPNTEAAGQADLNDAVFPGAPQYEEMLDRLLEGKISYSDFHDELDRRRS